MTRLLTMGADPNARDKRGTTVLMHAVGCGRIENLKAIIDAKADPNVLDRRGWTALHRAAIGGKRDMVRLLLDAKADANRCRSKGQAAPIHAAAAGGDVEIIKTLLGRGAGVDAPAVSLSSRSVRPAHDRPRTVTPLYFAVQFRRTEAAKFLLDKGARMDVVDYIGVPLLHVAVSYAKPPMLKLLLDRGADVNVKHQGVGRSAGSNALHVAARLRRDDKPLEMAKLLIEGGIDVNATTLEGKTPLDLATDPRIRELLERHGARSGKDRPRKTGDDEGTF